MDEISKNLNLKYENLKAIIKAYKSATIAFSSGVDSTLLLRVAKEVLGDNITAVTAVSATFPRREKNEAKTFCESLGVKQIFVDYNEINEPGFKENPKDRCYICKKGLFEAFLKVSENEGRAFVLEGSNVDDLSDYRPGLKALEELEIKSPLREANLTKDDIRRLSKALNLPTWDKQSFACLSSRIPYGEIITEEKLNIIEKSEDFLYDLGFRAYRVRMHESQNVYLARIEINQNDFDKLLNEELRISIHEKLKEYGFSYVSLDLMGYRTGSLNEVLHLD
ncbi:MAG: ATP-dependent sacrificial sulfur transferase LarE [Lachnospiraceae bacterium]|nr:ATP-dependent sacrificial sulfur transferase LarE [Lachnospiraceae bacterium]